ncbi:MAG: zf-HC2 domain-containing protein [Gemmatimonadota bacterium]
MPDSSPRPIDCETVARNLWEYLDGELPEERMMEIAAHLRDCLGCASHAAFEQALLDHIAMVRREPTDLPALEVRVRRALRAVELAGD